MGVKERREREKVETREKILEAARELFMAEGYDGVSMRKIADKIEYSPTAIYVYFADKDQLFLEICHEDFRRLAQSLIVLAQIADPVERLRKIGLAYVEFGHKNPNHYRTMFMTPHPPILEPELELELAGKGNPEEDAYEFLRATVAEIMQAGVFREELTDPNLVAQTLWAGVHGVISLQIAKSEDPWVPWRSLKKRAELMIDSQLHGLLRGK
ncbi:MAG TPA: TetR/AcrR family transcriptional regulator [Candidatus Eisenbacteria bacterium]|nr:TetR/AcrR family transcriptional regulator [Candidatus Eisenbacteria bacterium]